MATLTLFHVVKSSHIDIICAEISQKSIDLAKNCLAEFYRILYSEKEKLSTAQGGVMSDERDNQRSGVGRKVAKSVVLAPFRAVAKSGKLTKDQYTRTYQYGKSTLGGASDTIRHNWRRAHQQGENHQFAEIFGGPDGPELLQWNLRRFLNRKRVVLGFMAAFVSYGAVCVIAFQAFTGLLGMLGALLLGLSWATESQFRLWQLRTHRLSKEERGGFEHFWREEPIYRILDPELLGGRRHGS